MNESLELPPLSFDHAGLIPVVAQDRLTGEIRMVAYANAEAVRKTASEGRATFFSRSRNALWTKGETSGHFLRVHGIAVDCDKDCLLYQVTPEGPTCHTGKDSCFGSTLSGARFELAMQTQLGRLEHAIAARKESDAEKSYTKFLLDSGVKKIGEKVEEEASEFSAALVSESDDRVVSEAADLVFHTLVGLAARGLTLAQVLRTLDDRFGTSGHTEKAARPHGKV